MRTMAKKSAKAIAVAIEERVERKKWVWTNAGRD